MHANIICYTEVHLVRKVPLVQQYLPVNLVKQETQRFQLHAPALLQISN